MERKIQMKTKEKIEKLRSWMADHHLSAVIIPSDDPHKSEYVAEHWQARKWITGFSGSAGTAVVTANRAILWTDSRYYLQAENQLTGSGFELFKIGEPDVPTHQKWLSENLSQGDAIGLDGNVFTQSEVKKLKKELKERQIQLDTSSDPVAALWQDRPKRPETPAYSFSTEFTGKSRTEKIDEIRNKMSDYGAQCHLMTTLDDIAWTLNLRGSDVHTNPVNIAYTLILQDKTILFTAEDKINDDLKNELDTDRIDIMGYEEIASYLAGLQDQKSILIDPDNTSYALFNSVVNTCQIVEKPNPAIMLKAVKNDVEISHIRSTAVKDGIAVVNFLHWLDQVDSAEDISERSVADVLYEFRKKQALFVDNSFDPIMAFESHSAMCHYSASEETNVPIGISGMFLTDSGGNYFTGTTDITRTIHRGTPTPQQIIDYTLVLKGHISVATILFPEGTKGFQIDTLARQYLWKQGLNFGHGTGHGVGFFLCVHEGPARISPICSETALKIGMLLTNEPGLYRDGQYGIRLENQILVDEAFENEFGRFFKFETVTFCPFETDLIDVNMLSDEEKGWVNDYHKQVFEKLSMHLEQSVRDWLEEKTRPI